ncbi:MAG TPA: hypothetical protein VH325_03125 [Bryobacteraceae bacterium]|nr:hypothetical protein [Bryobacteraceae bacterium]
MDATLVRILLKAIIENRPDQIEPGELDDGILWLKQRTIIIPPDKHSSPQRQPFMQEAGREMTIAVAAFKDGDIAIAKEHALRALRILAV